MTLSGRIRVWEQFLAQEAVVEIGSRAGGGRARAGWEPPQWPKSTKNDKKKKAIWHGPESPRKTKFGKFEGV